jgi:hypothetical protein
LKNGTLRDTMATSVKCRLKTIKRNHLVAKKKHDTAAKKALRKWPQRTSKLWPPPLHRGFWVRAQPIDGQATAPRLFTPGARLFKTQPDGMWVYLAPDEGFCDVVSVEDCTNISNLNDKRSRYIPANHSLLVHCPLKWLLTDVRSGRFYGPRWEAAGTFSQPPTAPLVLPVRYLRVLYALNTVNYQNWMANRVPAGYEFFCRHDSLNSYNSQKMQDFLQQMSIGNHFYTLR